MDLVRQWVRDLVVLTLVAGMLEFLVPKSSMKGYVRTVMGLLVMLAMLAPALDLLGRPVAVDPAALALAGNAAPVDLKQVQRDAARLADVGTAQTGATFRARLSAAARAAAAAVPGVQRATASVTLGLPAGGSEPPPVESVQVRIWTAPDAAADRVLPAVRTAVAQRLELDPARVQAGAVLDAGQAEEGGVPDER